MFLIYFRLMQKYFPSIWSPHKRHDCIERKVEASAHNNNKNDSGFKIIHSSKHFFLCSFTSENDWDHISMETFKKKAETLNLLVMLCLCSCRTKTVASYQVRNLLSFSPTVVASKANMIENSKLEIDILNWQPA